MSTKTQQNTAQSILCAFRAPDSNESAELADLNKLPVRPRCGLCGKRRRDFVDPRNARARRFVLPFIVCGPCWREVLP